MAIAVTDRIRRGQSGQSPFAVAWQDDLKIAYVTVADLTARNAIPEWKRLPYMTCYVIAEGEEYTLGSNITIAGQVWSPKDYGLPADVVVEGDIFDINGYIQPQLIQNIFLNSSYVVASEAAMLALTSYTGNFFIRTDTSEVYIKLNNDDPADIGDFALANGGGAVISVNGQIGVVNITMASLLAVPANQTTFDGAVSNNVTVLGHSGSISTLQSDLISLSNTVGTLGSYVNTNLGLKLLSGLAQNPTAAQDGFVIKWDETLDQYVLAADSVLGDGTFLGLLDTPVSYTGQSGKFLRVNVAENALEFVTGGGGSGHTVQASGTPLTTRTNLNFLNGLIAADDAGNDATTVKLGGVLTANTTISGYKNLYLGEYLAGSYLAEFQLDSEINTIYTLVGTEFRGGQVGVDTYPNPYFNVKNIGASSVISLQSQVTSNYGSGLTIIPYRIDLTTTRSAPDAVVTIGAIVWKGFTGNGSGASAGSGELLEFRMRSGGTNAITPTGAGLQYVWNDPTKTAEQGRFDILTHVAGTAQIRASLDRYGWYYPSDLSASWTDRYLIDKGYANSSYWKVTGNTTLTGATAILAGGNNLTFGNNGLGNIGIFEMYADFTVNFFAPTVVLEATDIFLTANILNVKDAHTIVGETVSFPGLTYDIDNSANYTVRSLIDKGYADATYATISGAAYTSSNGITKTVNNFALGGALTGNTTITTTGYIFKTVTGVVDSLSISDTNVTLKNASNNLALDITNENTTLYGGTASTPPSLDIYSSAPDDRGIVASVANGVYTVGFNLYANATDATFTVSGNPTYFNGIEYSANFSANYTDRSLIDRGYAAATYAPISGGAYLSSATNSTQDGYFTGVRLLETVGATNYLRVVAGSDLSANRTFTITTGDGDRTLTLGGNLTTTGAFNTTFTVTGSNTITFPNASISVARTDAAQTFTGVQTMTSPSITTGIVTASTTFALFNTIATTLNIGGAATTMTIGGTPTTALTHSYSANATATGVTKTVNLATAGAAGSTTNVNIGSATTSAILGTLSLNFPTILTAANNTTVNLWNTLSTTVNFAGAATSLTIGATTGTMNLRNATLVLTQVPATDASFSTSQLLVRDSTGNLDVIAASGGGTANFLRADGTWAAAGGGTGDMLLGTIQTVTADKNFNNSTLAVWNPAGTFKYVFTSSALITADKTVTLPLLTASDTFVFEAFGATLTNKTLALGSNTISGTKAQFNTAVTDGDLLFTGDAWLTTGTTTLTGAVTIAQATNDIYFLDGEVLFGPTAATITASTKVDIRGTGITTGNALRVADSANTERFKVLDNGLVTITRTAAANTHLSLSVNGSTPTQATHPLSITSVDNVGYYEPVFETPSALRISSTDVGTTNQFRLLPYQGSIYFQNTNAAGSIYLSAINAADAGLIGFKATNNEFNGNVSIGASFDALYRLRVRGAGTTSGVSLLIQDSATTERFKVLDNGYLYSTANQESTPTAASFNFTANFGADDAYRPIARFVKKRSSAPITSNNGLFIDHVLSNTSYADLIALRTSVNLTTTTIGVENTTLNIQGLSDGSLANFLYINPTAIGIGQGAAPIAAFDIAIGTLSVGGNNGSISLGYRAGSTSGTKGAQAISIGYNANQGTANIGADSIAIGKNTEVNGDYGIAIGSGATTIGSAIYGGMVIGWNSSNTQAGAVVIGNTITNTNGDVIIGLAASGGSESVSIGVGAIGGLTGVSLGRGAYSNTNYSIAIGANAGIASGTKGARYISIGYYNSSSALNIGADSIAMGYDSIGTATRAFIIGNGAVGGGAPLVNSIQDSFGLGWNEATPSILFAKAADSYFNTTANIGFFTGSGVAYNTMTKGFFMGDAGVAPTGNPTAGAYFWVDSTTHLPKWRVPGGTVYTLSDTSAGGVSDGTYGEITVTSAGTVWALNATAISGKTAITSVDTAADYLLIWDATDSLLKKVLPSNLGLGGGSSWSLATGGTLTGVNTITSNTEDGIIFNGTWTATGNDKSYFKWAGTITGSATTFHTLIYNSRSIGMVAGANGQSLINEAHSPNYTLGAFTSVSIVGIDYNGNVVTGTAGEHIGLRIRNGSALIGGTNMGDTTTRVKILGIGTTTGATLQLLDSASTSRLIVYDNGNILSGSGSITANTKLDVRGIGTTTDKALRIADSSNTERFVVLDNGEALFTRVMVTDYNENYSIAARGRVLIGSDPLIGTRGMLQINTGTANSPTYAIAIGSGSAINASISKEGDLLLYNGTSSFGVNIVTSLDVALAGEATHVQFGRYATNTEVALAINRTFRVSPTGTNYNNAAIVVLGNMATVADYKLQVDGAARIRGTGTSTGLALVVQDNANTQRAYIQDDGVAVFGIGGNVGIGVAPSFKLDVNGVINTANYYQTNKSSGLAITRFILDQSNIASASGTTTIRSLELTPTYNLTGTYAGIMYGIDYNPTLTSMTGVTHIALRATSGSVLIGGSTLTANTQVDIRGTGTTTNTSLRVADSADTERFKILDNGNVYIPTTTSSLFIGALSNLSTATPATINMGGSYADTAVSTKAKFKLYSTGGTAYGLGITSGSLNFFLSNAIDAYTYYWNDVGKMKLRQVNSGTAFSANLGGIGDGTATLLLTQDPYTAVDGTFAVLRGTPGAHTLTATSEFVAYDFQGATETWADSTVATQRFTWFKGFTANKTTTTLTITNAYNVYIDKTTAGAGVTISNNFALGVNGKLSLVEAPANDDALTNILVRDTGTGEIKYRLASSLGGGGTPGGADTQVQYNNGGAFGGMSVLTYNDATNILSYSPTLDEATGNEIAMNIVATVNKATSGDFIGLSVQIIPTLVQGTANHLLNLAYGSNIGTDTVFYVAQDGYVASTLMTAAADLGIKRSIWELGRAATSTPTAGFGLSIDAYLSTTTSYEIAGEIAWQWTTPTNASRASRLDLNVRSTTTTNGIAILSTGQLVLKQYLLSSSFTGTPVGSLQFDASGNILTAGLPGDMLLGTAQTVSAAKTFLDDTLYFRNPGNTFSYFVRTSALAASRNITLPLLSASDTFAFAGFANAWGAVNQNIAATGKWQEAGVSISPIGKHDVWIPASAMLKRVTTGSSNLTQIEFATSLANLAVLDFDQTTAEFASFSVSLPRNWNNGTITYFVYWTAAAGTGTVSWAVKAGAYSNDDPLTAALGTAITTTDTLIATGDVHISDESAALTIAGTPADNDLIVFEIGRDITDTLSADARLLGVKVIFTTDAAVTA